MTIKAKGYYLRSRTRPRNPPKTTPIDNSIISLKTIRLSLSGALLGVAIVGIIANGNHEAIGAFLGGSAVLIAKLRHFI